MATDDVTTIEEDPALSEAQWRHLHNLLIDAFAENAPHIDPPSSLEQISLGDLKRKSEDETLLVANVDGEIVGCAFVRMEPDHLYLGKLAVATDRRREGIGLALVRQTCTVAEREGLPVVRLQTRIELEENRKAFEAMSFKVVGETAHPGYDRPTSITMERRL